MFPFPVLYIPFRRNMDILLCFSRSAAQSEDNTLRCYNVTDRLFTNVVIENNDASSSVDFSEAFLKYKIKSRESITLSWFWCDAIEEIVKNYYSDENSNESRYQVLKQSRQCVQKFIQDGCNSKHLAKVKDAKSEAEIQAILAHHLFSPLGPTGTYVIDGRFLTADLKKCPACEEDLVYGDTSIGNPSYWHGYPDIFIDKSTVKIEMNESCYESEESQEFEWPEEIVKKQRLMEQKNAACNISVKVKTDEICHESEESQEFELPEQVIRKQRLMEHRTVAGGEGSSSTINPDIFSTCNEVKNDQYFQTEKYLKQSFAQAITNAFYQAQQNPKLQSLCIPSFLASDKKVKIIMYNCEQDRLYISEDMNLFDTLCDHGLNVGTIVSIWLALNFENLQNTVNEEYLEAIELKKTSFQETLPVDVLSVYKNKLYRPLPKERKQIDQPLNASLAVTVSKSDYARSLLERLESLDSNFLKNLTKS